MIKKLSSAPVHGGDLSQAGDHFGEPEAGWLDLSTGINPRPYPDIDVSPEALARLPSSGALKGLLAAARTAYGIPDDAGLCAAPGTQAILQALPEIVVRAGVAVVSPTYGEHAYIWRQTGYAVSEIDNLDQTGDCRIVVIVNPNNPDGRRIEPAMLDALRADLAATGGFLIVDEAFADVTPSLSMAPSAGREGLLVLRSFGKFFGLAGIRLGFAAGPADLVELLAARLGPWAVSGPAIEIGTRALADSAWIEATRAALAASRARLDRLLLASGFSIVGGTDLYRLVACDGSHACFQNLAGAGVLVREFPDRPGWLRFGLPGSEADFNRLERALE